MTRRLWEPQGISQNRCGGGQFAPVVGETRAWAEARSQFAAAMTLLSAGTPMFFMGEEVGAQKPYRYHDFLQNREDILGEAEGHGAALRACYRDLIALSINQDAIRVIAFHRWNENDDFLVVGSLNDAAFNHGYRLHSARLADSGWQEIFNTDVAAYAGWNVGNGGEVIMSVDSTVNAVLPASGVVIFRKQ